MTVPTQTVAPQSVVVSSWLHIVGAVLGLLGAIVGLALLPQTISATKRTLAATGSSTSGVDLNAIATGSAIGGVAIGTIAAVAFGVLTIVFARKMRAGRNWARIVLTVFAALQIFGILSLYGVGFLHFLVVAAAVVLSFLPTSNAYFRSFAAARPGTV